MYTINKTPRPKTIFAAAAGIGLCLSLPLNAAELAIEVKPVTETTGQMMIAVYDSADKFQKEPVRALSQPATAGAMKIRITDLPVGDYAVMLYQDINDNKKLDSNMIGMPTEPWGGSLQRKRIFGAPKWADTRFELPEAGTAITIDLN